MLCDDVHGVKNKILGEKSKTVDVPIIHGNFNNLHKMIVKLLKFLKQIFVNVGDK